MFSTIFSLVKTAVSGKKTIATAVGLLGLGAGVATDTFKASDPYAQAAALILVALAFIFQRLGAKNEKRDIFDALAEALKKE